MKFINALGALALVSGSLVQAANVTTASVSYCPGDDVCMAVNIPSASASSGSGDIYFQITGPTTMSWIGIGQGSSMTGANIFMVYQNAAGDNVTLSPRSGTGNKAPSTTSAATVTLLSGSGISNGVMTANVKCSNCNSWTGGTMSFTDTASAWIWAYKTGAAVSSDSTTVSLSQHSSYGDTTLNLVNAAGGSSANPFVNTVATTTSSGLGASSGGGESIPADFPFVRMAHAILTPLAFVLFFPAGAMLIRAFSFNNLIWVHAGWMIFTWVVSLAGLGMGVFIAYVTQQLNTTHSVLGLFVIISLMLQPISGILHHTLYKKTGGHTPATYGHVWWGRAIVTLGMINGGLGLNLSENTVKGGIAYGAIAGFMWVLWIGVCVGAFIKVRKDLKSGPFEKDNSSTENIRRGAAPQLPNSPIAMNHNSKEPQESIAMVNFRPVYR